MPVRHIALFLILIWLGAGVAPGADSGRSAKAIFGGFAVDADKHKAPMAADLDGDGRLDDVYVLSQPRQGKPDPAERGITFINPWNGKPRNPRGESAAVGIRLASGARYVVYNDEFFSSPIWKQKVLPVTVVKRGTREHREFARQAIALRHDIVVLGTEAGIDIALYWNGKHFALLQPNEVP